MEKLMKEGKWNPKQGFFCMLPNEMILEIFEYLDPISLYRMNTFGGVFPVLANQVPAKILDLRGHPDLMSEVVHFVHERNIKIKGLHFANGQYSDEDVKCIETIIQTNADRLTQITFPPLRVRLLKGQLIKAALHCKNLEELDVSASRPTNESTLSKYSKYDSTELSDHLANIIKNNRNLNSIKINYWGFNLSKEYKIAEALYLTNYVGHISLEETLCFVTQIVLKEFPSMNVFNRDRMMEAFRNFFSTQERSLEVPESDSF